MNTPSHLRVTLLCAALCCGLPAAVVSSLVLAAEQAAEASASAHPWPRTFTIEGQQLTLHQPQLESWQGNVLKGRLAVAVKTGTVKDDAGKAHDQLVYGVLWFSARSETDKAAREVDLKGVTADRVSFPTAKGSEARYLGLIRKMLPVSTLTVDLDQLESALAITQNTQQQAAQAVNNTPPQVLFSFGPGLLVLVDGKPVYKPAGVAGVERVINTRSLLLRSGGKHYLRFAGRWAEAGALSGPWALAADVPAALNEAMQQAVAAHLVDVLDKPAEPLKQALAAGKAPAIFVSDGPAELIEINGEPQFEPLAGTQLSYVANTGADVFVDHADNDNWFVLLSGRWFSAASTKGPWRHVEGGKLPADFLKIASDSPKAAVLASIPGTPEARESLIANAIPQTATVRKSQAHLSVSYDGSPQFSPISGTTLAYAVNTAVPVIRLSNTAYYAVQNGVWFTARTATGPWSVAINVPAVIYTIPATSPVHYVTYVYVYGSNGDEVYVGYTPGYYGTVVSNGVVVYGTGYVCNAWIGDVWYSCPATYGYGVAFGWDAWAGWSFGFAWGMAWGAAWYGPWWGPWYGPGYWPGYWGGGVAVTNVYGRWGNVAASGVRAAWADPWSGNYGTGVRGSFHNDATGGRGWGYAGWNSNAYTGTTTAAAGGVRYNPETGRVVGGHGAAAGNADTGNAAAAGSRAQVNTETGRVSHESGGMVHTDEGTTAGGRFSTSGKAGDATGAGYVHRDADTGQISHGGVIRTDDHVYAGKDGNVYQYTPGQGWEQKTLGGATRDVAPASSGLDTDRLARERGADRINNRSVQPNPTITRPNFENHQFNRGNFSPRFSGRMGGGRFRR
ncbi:hypothetical protein [Chitinolyticbacter meiyuanensis]|uniref:hypothetical protein n=1 Tax=Chitinolyticbacter meiyuanensis TaxID=682798 RepID=UPI0011E5B809|nr:hypothetical protein [Chitinolyticbacter meiyuanensis]